MKKILFTTLIMLAFANIGWCANQPGTIGTTSTANMDVQVTIPKLIQINNLGNGLVLDVPLTANEVTSGGKVLTAKACISSNLHANEGFNVTAKNGADGSTDFYLSNEESGHESETLGYSVRFQSGVSDYISLSHASPSTAGTYKSDGQGFKPNCENSNVQVTFTSEALKAARHGTYSGVLTLVVAPD